MEFPSMEAKASFCPIKSHNASILSAGKPLTWLKRTCAWADDCPMHPLSNPRIMERYNTFCDGSDQEDWYWGYPKHTDRGVGDIDRMMAVEDYLLTGNERVIDGTLEGDEIVEIISLEEPDEDTDDEFDLDETEDPGVLQILDNPGFISIRSMEEMEILAEERSPGYIVLPEYKTPSPKFVRGLKSEKQCPCYAPKGKDPKGVSDPLEAILKAQGAPVKRSESPREAKSEIDILKDLLG